MNWILFITVSIALLQLSSASTGFLCNTCMSTIDFFKSILVSKASLRVGQFFDYLFCIRKNTDDYCRKREINLVGNKYYPMFTVINSEEICNKMSFCHDYKYIEDLFSKYSFRVLKDTPPFVQHEIEPKKNPFKILVVTDIHIDFGYKENRSVSCKSAICCRDDSGLPNNGSNEKSGKYGYLGNCDIPLITAESFVDYASEYVKPDAIIYLGDNPAHNMWEQTKEGHLEELKIFSKLLERFNTTVYPALGNHEGYPCDQFDTSANGSHQWITNEVLDIWNKWLTSEMRDTFRKNGCYSTKVNGTELKIIQINPFVELSNNRYSWGNQTDPLEVLAWLESELKASESINEAVLIIGHIPPSQPPTNPYWSERFMVLVERYANIIRGLIHGHIHQDFFVMMKGINKRPVSVTHVCPSLTTASFNRPSFRVYEVDRDTGTLTDYVQYSMDLVESNNNRTPVWKKSYRFTNYYGVKSLSVKSHNLVLEKMKTNKEIFKKALIVKYQEGPKWKSAFNNTARHKIIMCDYESSTISEKAKCIEAKYRNIINCFSYGFHPLPVCRSWEQKIPNT